jgi:hypothetical protein
MSAPRTVLLLGAALTVALSSPSAAENVWTVTGARASFSLSDGRLRDLGLEIVSTRETRPGPAPIKLGMEPPVYSFVVDELPEVRFRTSGERFEGFVGMAPILPVQGGLAFRARHRSTQALLDPLFLFDFALEVVPGTGRVPIRIRTGDRDLPVPLEVRNAWWTLEAERGELSLRMGDLVISEEWAERLGQPSLEGKLVGAFDLRLAATPARPRVRAPEPPSRASDQQELVLDILLRELYGIDSAGRIGIYPNGTAGLTAATTACNNGEVIVPWNAPMEETHPFIGLALYREKDGALEMIGQNWVKHAWYALANDDCDLGCDGGGGTYMEIGCSDTYSAANNASRYYLGPREEVDPHIASWEACGSFFDATPVDCERDYLGIEPDEVAHRLEVDDVDLGDTTATYLYEGVYFVADDDSLYNNIGWRECTMTWSGTDWDFTDVGGGLDVILGAPIFTWGDAHDSTLVSPDDGWMFHSVKVTDLGGGSWHYEYAVYNRTCGRGMRLFEVPITGAVVSNIGFHDIDHKPETDWSSSFTSDRISWWTDDYATVPDAPALFYQTQFNFRFDADRPPVVSKVKGGLFRPGVGTTFFLNSLAPYGGGPTAIAEGERVEGLRLYPSEPNPFATSTRLTFSQERAGAARLSILDVNGRTIQVLLDGPAPAGVTSLPWDGRDATGSRVASGVYFFRLEAEGAVRTVKGTLLR